MESSHRPPCQRFRLVPVSSEFACPPPRHPPFPRFHPLPPGRLGSPHSRRCRHWLLSGLAPRAPVMCCARSRYSPAPRSPVAWRSCPPAKSGSKPWPVRTHRVDSPVPPSAPPSRSLLQAVKIRPLLASRFENSCPACLLTYPLISSRPIAVDPPSANAACPAPQRYCSRAQQVSRTRDVHHASIPIARTISGAYILRRTVRAEVKCLCSSGAVCRVAKVNPQQSGPVAVRSRRGVPRLRNERHIGRQLVGHGILHPLKCGQHGRYSDRVRDRRSGR